MTRLWCKMNNMDRERINYKVFAWSRRLALSNVKNWTFHVAKFYREISFNRLLDTNIALDVNTIIPQVDSVLMDMYLRNGKKL